MVDNVKLDNVGAPIPSTIDVRQKNHDEEGASIQHILKEEGVLVSNKMNSLIHLLKCEGDTVEDNSRVMAVKSQIQNGTYAVDTQKLSENLLNNGILE